MKVYNGYIHYTGIMNKHIIHYTGIMNKILTSRYKLNSDNIVYLLHKSKTFINTSDSVLG